MYPTVILAAIIIIALMVFFTVIPVGMWISAVASGVKISIFSLVGMKIRRVKPAKIVAPMIKATKAGIKVKTNELEAHYLAGGNVDNVVKPLSTGSNLYLPCLTLLIIEYKDNVFLAIIVL